MKGSNQWAVQIDEQGLIFWGFFGWYMAAILKPLNAYKYVFLKWEI